MPKILTILRETAVQRPGWPGWPSGLAHFADPRAKISPRRLAAGISALAQFLVIPRDSMVGGAVAGLAGLGFRMFQP